MQRYNKFQLNLKNLVLFFNKKYKIMNVSKLKRIIKDSGHTYKEVAEAVNMTEAGFHHALTNATLKVTTLEGISAKIKVPVTAFFESSTVDFGTHRIFETLEQIVNERLNK
jgi:hypothetical protein